MLQFKFEVQELIGVLLGLATLFSLISTLTEWYKIPLGPFGGISIGLWHGSQNNRDSNMVALEILSILVILASAAGFAQVVIEPKNLSMVTSYTGLSSIASIMCIAIFVHSHQDVKIGNYGIGFYLQTITLFLTVITNSIALKYRRRVFYTSIL